MGLARPVGRYAEQMLEAAGWPDVDEDILFDRAGEHARDLRDVTEVLATCKFQHADVFDGGIWSGAAARAASRELEANIHQLTALQTGLATAISWQRYVATLVAESKWHITENIQDAEAQIRLLENDLTLDATERTTAIEALISVARDANTNLVATAADDILASKRWRLSESALQDLLGQKAPPILTSARFEHQYSSTPPKQSALTPQLSYLGTDPQLSLEPSENSETPKAREISQPTAPNPHSQVAAVRPPPTAGSSCRAQPGPDAPLPAAVPAQFSGAGVRGGARPAPMAASASALNARLDEDSARPPINAVPNRSKSPITPDAPSGAASGGHVVPGPLIASKASNRKPVTRLTATDAHAPRTRVGARTDSAESATSGDAAAVALIPVTPARAERDAIANASARRSTSVVDPLQVARRIAAALNAPDMNGCGALGFYWITGVTTDGAIVVSNSYGLAYIPEQLCLPKSVIMASADQALSAAERRSWATYPVVAVQRWAAHYQTELRAVIGTHEHLANSDCGAAKIALEAEDIPASGRMPGRSRLEVVDPKAAALLASTTDSRLTNLLPAEPLDVPSAKQRVPAATGPDSADRLLKDIESGTFDFRQLLALTPPSGGIGWPADERPSLWFEVMKPMVSSDPCRQDAHLRAFHRYALDSQEVAVKQAHTTREAVTKRAAVADWLYWMRVAELLDAAALVP